MADVSDLRLLAYFAVIARTGSISGAARALRLSPAVVSEALSALEDKLGVTLARRTTRSFALTDAGGRVLRSAEAAMAAADTAMAAGGSDRTPAGPVRLTAPTELAVAWLPSRLRAFHAAYPGVAIELEAEDGFVNLSGGPIDLAVSAAYSAPSAIRPANAIAMLPLVLAAAPDLVDAGPKRETAARRIERIGLIGPRLGGGKAGRGVVVRGRRSGGSSENLSAKTPISVNNQTAAARLAREGLGAALLIEATVADDLAAGRLKRVDPKGDYGAVSVRLRMRDRFPTPAAGALRDFLRDQAGHDLPKAGRSG